MPAWAYYAEVYDDIDPSQTVWTCMHKHESPQLAHGCAAIWIDDTEGESISLSEQTAG